MLSSYRDIDFQNLLRGYLGEIPLSIIRPFFGFLDAFKPGVLKDVILQHKLDQLFCESGALVKQSAKPIDSSFVQINIRRLKKLITDLKYKKGSVWANYTKEHSYSDLEFGEKVTFVSEALARAKPESVIDIGSNSGVFSDLARARAQSVISIDADATALNALYLRTRGERSQSCLVSNFADPSPALGWELKERKSFQERVSGDFFLALALIHHLRISANIPLSFIVQSFSKIAKGGVIEWVDKSDDMVQKMLALRPDVFDDYHWEEFKSLLERRFKIIKITSLKNGSRKLCEVLSRDA